MIFPEMKNFLLWSKFKWEESPRKYELSFLEIGWGN
jgi:hypothetical protein